jgi:23S rRNA pseudouridine1911/1915/1917 synthase
MEILNIIIPDRMKGYRLDSALAEMLPDYSRSKITAWIKSGDALINNKIFKPKEKAVGSELVLLTLNQKQSNDWIAEKIPLNVVYEDE